jgi:uncharacterized protein (TIGR00369 family)
MEHLHRLETMYGGSNINSGLYRGIALQFEGESACIRFEAGPAFHHALGGVHGSVLFKLLDDAAFFAAQAREQEYFILTASFSLHFIRPFQEGRLSAIGTLRTRTRSFWICESRILDERNREIAFGSGTMMRSKTLLKDVPGYLTPFQSPPHPSGGDLRR